MEGLFAQVLRASLQSGVLIAVILVLRLVLRGTS